MFFDKLYLAAALALGASALPQGLQSTTTNSATPSSSSSSSTSSATPSSSAGAGGGGITIVNNLDTSVNLWSTSSTAGSGDKQSLTAGGGSSTESWQTTSDGSGISIKLSTSEDQSSVLQFEYTNTDDGLFWDLSSIDLDKDSAFVKGGFSATSDDGSCAAVTCDAGDADCAASYQKPDDVDTHSCSSGAAITLTLG
ncbi:hypothetical protein BJX62DRAFT_203605 [Aspergillus germanicus]